MPLVVDQRDWDRWLDPDEPAAAELLSAPPDISGIDLRGIDAGEQRSQQRARAHRTGGARQPTGWAVLAGPRPLRSQAHFPSRGAAADRGRAKSDQATITVHNPADGAVSGTVPIDDAETVAAKARSCGCSSQVGGDRPARRKVWMKWQDWVLDNADHLTEVLMSETGSRAATPPWNRSIADAIKLLGEQRRGSSSPTATPRRPHCSGQEAHHGVPPLPGGRDDRPWNFPLAMLALDLVPALAAGAAVLLKPSGDAPFGGGAGPRLERGSAPRRS